MIGELAQARHRAQQAGDRQQVEGDSGQLEPDGAQGFQGAEGAFAHVLQLLRQGDEAEEAKQQHEDRRAAAQQRPQQVAVEQAHGAARRASGQAMAKATAKAPGAHQRWATSPCSTSERMTPMKLK